MDDLQMLSTVLTKPGPSLEVVDRRRRQLQNVIHGSVRRRRIGWTAGALGLAAAAAVTVVVASDTTPANRPPSGRQILLAAATAAERRPADSGTYWHVKVVFRLRNGTYRTTETWTRRDGREWTALGAPGTVSEIRGAKGFPVAGSWMSFARIQRLPTTPAGLNTWIADARKRAAVPSVKGAFTVSTLSSLLSQVPAPPKVRAAAFRLLAMVPDVTSRGAVPGGQALLMPGPNPGSRMRLVVDPATSLIRGYSFDDSGATGTATAEWTNRLPKVVRAPLPG